MFQDLDVFEELVTTSVDGYQLVGVGIDLYRGIVVDDVHLAPYILDRNTVEALVQTDIAVVLNSCGMTFLQLEAYRIELAHAFPFEVLVLLATALAATGHRSVVVSFKSNMERLIQGLQVIEHLTFKLGVYVLINELHGKGVPWSTHAS